MLFTALLRSLSRSPGALLAFVLSPALTVAAQQGLSFSPALPTAGNSVSISVPGTPSPDMSLGIFLQGPFPSSTTVAGSYQVPVINGNSTLVTPPLAAGSYLVSVQTSGQYQQPEVEYNTLTVYGPNGSDLAALNGQYVFQLSGEAANLPAGINAVAVAGSFNADGNGNITSGVLDINSPSGLFTSLPATGTYQLNAYGVGSLTLNTAAGSFPFSLATKQLFSGVFGPSSPGSSQNLPATPSISSALLSTNAGGLLSASGPLILNSGIEPNGNHPPFSEVKQSISGTYVAGFSGFQGSSATPISGAGQFTFTTGGSVTETSTLSANGGSFSTGTLTGTYTPFDVNGRSTLTLSNGPGSSAPSQMFAVYQLGAIPQSSNAPAFFFVSITPRSQDGLLSGRGDQTPVQP